MANLTKGYVFGSTESVTNAKLHSLVDSATITGIVNADVAAGAAIDFSKIAQTDIDGSKLTGLANIVSGAGVIPAANLTSVAQKGANSDITSLAGLTTVLSRAQGGLASDVANNAASGVVFLNASSQLPAVSGALLTGVSKFQLFTSNGTFTSLAGVTKVYLTMIGGGGGGAGCLQDNSGGGGSSGAFTMKYPYIVTPGNGYAVVIGTGGAGGAVGANNGSVGVATTFNTTISATGGNGGINGTPGNGGAAPTGYEIAVTAVSATSSYLFAGGNGYRGETGGSGYGGAGGGSPLGSGAASGGVGTNGVTATEFGGGGSGGGGGGTTHSGGAGASGVCLVEW